MTETEHHQVPASNEAYRQSIIDRCGALGISFAALSSEAGMGPNYIYNIVNRVHGCSLDACQKIEAAFDRLSPAQNDG